MKRAYEYDRELIDAAIPKILSEEEQTWENAFTADDRLWEAVKLLWGSHVPGSYAPERVLLAGIQSMYNMGYDVTEAEALLPKALEYREKEDKVKLTKLTAEVFHLLNEAKKIEGHRYHDFSCYDSFEKILVDSNFPEYAEKPDVHSADFFDKIYFGWKTQVVGASFGTALEGYTTENLRKTFGEVREYIRKPSTYNDDITYEIAFLEAFREKGYDLSSSDIALEWVGRIPSGWSAEDIALKNLMLGIFPPESGYRSNPFREWIGAQMRGVVCGMIAPANPVLAAELAFKDGVISHHNNGVIGEIFNAVLASMAFVEKDMRTLVPKAIDCMPKNSEYKEILDFTLQICKETDNYDKAWKKAELRFKEYNWIHAYPNAAIEVIALYYCQNDFDSCLSMIGMMGQDVDCNAAQVATLFGIAYGNCIGQKWLDPLPEDIKTYVRGYEDTTYRALTDLLISSLRKYWKK